MGPDVANKRRLFYDSPMDEGRKRVLLIVAGILVARHLKNPEDLHESRPSPRTGAVIASAVQWPDRGMRRLEGVYRCIPRPRIRSGRPTIRDVFDVRFAHLLTKPQV